MVKFISLVIALLVTGGMGFVSAQGAQTVTGSKTKSVKKEARSRIVRLEDRIQDQRRQVRRDLIVDKLTAVQAQACNAFLDNLESRIKAENKADGWKNTMPDGQYESYQAALDANNAVVNQKKKYYYLYGPYTDRPTDFDYFRNSRRAVGVPTPTVTGMEAVEPRVFELKDRIHQQRERIDQGLSANSLTGDEARGCRDFLTSVEGRIKAVFKANGSKTMTREQYAGFIAALDTNSAVIHEEKYYHYYYSPDFDQYSYWD